LDEIWFDKSWMIAESNINSVIIMITKMFLNQNIYCLSFERQRMDYSSEMIEMKSTQNESIILSNKLSLEYNKLLQIVFNNLIIEISTIKQSFNLKINFYCFF
jgi:F0F1-type ATP synthase gamma subunit